MSIDHSPAPVLRSARQVREQLGGISDVTLWRRVNDPRLDFPQPVKITGRNFFDAEAIDAWIERQFERQPEPEAI